jgi:hypothetical protein
VPFQKFTTGDLVPYTILAKKIKVFPKKRPRFGGSAFDFF